MNFPNLLNHIQETHRWFSGQVARQINTALTLRNWLIGMHLFEYEQKGQDRAEYGERLYDEIVLRLKNQGLKGFGKRSLYLHKDFYLTYPQILQSVIAQLQKSDNQNKISKSTLLLSLQDKVENTESGKTLHSSESLLERLTYTHFIELLKCDTALQRTFYETEAMVNNWSVRELRRAMDSMLFERTGLSRAKILKCHVLFDLKIGQFDHADAGQMNLYLNYYREHEMAAGDALPVGVILCAQKNQALVHYATGGLPQQVFVSKYLLNLPTEEELSQIVREEQKKLS